MYKEHFGCHELPFSIAPDPRFLFMSERHREALAHLVYGVKTHGGFVLVTGEVGTGKTTICRCLLEQIPEHVDLAFILNPRLTTSELLATICDEFRISYPEGNRSVKVFVDRINAFLISAHASGRQAVLILDEAQNLHPSLLEQIRLLTNLETNERKLLQIIMLGQPELLRILERDDLRQLSQRITARYHLGRLTLPEVGAYVKHRLEVAGIRQELFPPAVIKNLYRLSNGVPRLINVICDRALLGAYVLGEKSISKKILNTAAREVLGDKEKEGQHRPGKRLAAFSLFLLAAVLVLLASVFMPSIMPENQVEEAAAPEISKTVIVNPVSETHDVVLQHEVVEAPAPAVEIPEEIMPFTWPADLSVSASKATSYEKLFAAWNIVYSFEEHGQACQYASFQGLRCLFRRGSIGSLRQLNRPAVLKFSDESGQEFYGTLLRLTDKTSTLALGMTEKEVPLAMFSEYWLGEFTLLWRPPPDYKGVTVVYGKNGISDWLAGRLAISRGEDMLFPAGGASALQQQVSLFQASQGLKPDGIAGPQTLIRLNTVTDSTVPVLLQEAEEK